MEIDGASLTTIAGFVGTAGAALAGGVKVLADKIGARFEKMETRLDECNAKHVADREEIGGMRSELQSLKTLIETKVTKVDGAR